MDIWIALTSTIMNNAAIKVRVQITFGDSTLNSFSYTPRNENVEAWGDFVVLFFKEAVYCFPSWL